jgi:plastocyanin
VAVGATVTWTWGSNASNGHNVTFAGGPASDTQVSGTFQRTFNTAGTFSYQCTVHGPMTGEVRVQ